MSNYKISIPEVADTEGIIDMHVQSWLDVYPNERQGISRDYIQECVKRFTNDDGHKKRLSYIEEAHTNPDYLLRIAKNEEERVVGFIDARRQGIKNELKGLYIDKSEYGNGLAQQLSQEALSWLGDEKDITLTVVSYNSRAQAFYSKIGFKIVPNSEHIRDDDVIPVIDMIRKANRGDKT